MWTFQLSTPKHFGLREFQKRPGFLGHPLTTVWLLLQSLLHLLWGSCRGQLPSWCSGPGHLPLPSGHHTLLHAQGETVCQVQQEQCLEGAGARAGAGEGARARARTRKFMEVIWTILKKQQTNQFEVFDPYVLYESKLCWLDDELHKNIKNPV